MGGRQGARPPASDQSAARLNHSDFRKRPVARKAHPRLQSAPVRGTLPFQNNKTAEFGVEAMPQDMVLTVIARDRPGLIKALSETIDAHGGNWVDSSMARLGGEFAGILRITAPSQNVAALEAALGGLGDAGIWVTIRRGAEDTQAAETAAARGRHIRITLTGVDHPGIIHEVSTALAALEVSIDELNSRIFSGSMSGEAMFEANADVVLPAGLDEAQVRDTLEDIAHDLVVELLVASDAA